MPEFKKITLDPTKIDQSNLSIVEMEALNQFLKRTTIGNYWVMNQPFDYNYKNVRYSFCFTYSVLKRVRIEKSTGDRFEVFNPESTPLGAGGFGIVYPILGTIKFEAGRPVIKTTKDRVVKIEKHDPIDRRVIVEYEYRVLKYVGHLNAKPPVYIDSISQGTKSFLVMNRVKGISLEKILASKDPAQKIDLTVLQRIELTLAILHAIKKQVREKKLIHRDLKPGNIIVDLEQSPPKATIIDFAMAIKETETVHGRAGTHAYKAPETHTRPPQYSEKSDAYSAGRVLSYLWGDNYKNYYINRETPWEEIQEKSTNKNLFSHPAVKLFTEDKDTIRECLSGLLREDVAERSTLDDALEQFSTIKIPKYKMEVIQRLSKVELLEYEHTLKRKIEHIQSLLLKLAAKGDDLRRRGFTDVAEIVENLENQLSIHTQPLLESPDPSILSTYRDACFQNIDNCKEILKNHRDLRWIVAEIGASLGLLCVGYVVALGVNYARTGRIGLFAQTKSEQLTDEIKNTISSMILV